MYKKGDALPVEYLLSEGSATFFNLYVDHSQVDFWISQPGIQFSKLLLVTNLSLMHGFDHKSLQAFSQSIYVEASPGFVAPVPVATHVRFARGCPQLEIGVGPPCMYQTRITIRTKSDKTFKEDVDRIFKTSDLDHLVFGLVAVQQDVAHHNHGSESAGVLSHMV